MDTERVIVSPSADPCLNRRLSASSHTKGHAALHGLERAIVQNKKVEWPKYLTETQERSPIPFLCQDDHKFYKKKINIKAGSLSVSRG